MKYLLTLLWLLGAIVAQAQEYTGHVADKEDGAPVAGASSTSRRWATAGSRFRPTPGGCSCC